MDSRARKSPTLLTSQSNPANVSSSHSIARVAVVLEAETQVVGGMHQQIDGTKLTHRRPIVTVGQAIQAVGQRGTVVSIPVVVALCGN